MTLTHKNQRIVNWLRDQQGPRTVQDIGDSLSGKVDKSKAWAWAYHSIRELKMMELIENGPPYVGYNGRAFHTYQLTDKGLWMSTTGA